MNESPYPMLPVAQALDIVLAHAQRLPATEVTLAEAGSRVLAEAVVAQEPLPPFAASVKDGYAVVASDGPGVYPVIGEARAGAVAAFQVEPGSTAYITTGSPLPQGADAVVMVEYTEDVPSDDERRMVRVQRSVRAGDDVRPVGVDVAAGETVLAAGEHIGPAEVGLLATVGLERVHVFGRPHVAVLSTGDELAEVGEEPGPGQIRDSNRYMIMESIREAGGTVLDLGIARDSADELVRRVEQGLVEADMLVTSGGVSVGGYDLIKPLFERKGTVHFGRILMKPGKPFTFATIQENGRTRLAFGLPGNPVSSLVTFNLFAIPALRKMMGWADPNLRRVRAFLAQPLTLDPERPEYHRAILTWDGSLNEGVGGYLATSTGSQASSRLLSMRTANALLELPSAHDTLAQGTAVGALLIRSDF